MLLSVHAAIEEEIFYLAAREADDELYDAKVTVLGECIDHHVKEEQDEMFPQCRESAMDLKAIGTALAERKAELMAEMTEGMEETSA